MSDDIYDVDPKPVQDKEIRPVTHPLLNAPDALALAGPTHYQGVDWIGYGQPDTAVTVVEGCQCVHDGVAHYGGETLRVPQALAAYWVRSGWALAESESGGKSEPPAPVKAVAKAPAKRQPVTGNRRRG